MNDNFLELKDLEKAKKLLENIPNGVERAATRAINRSLTTLKKELKKEVTKNYGIKSTDIEKALSTKKATFTALNATIKAKSPVLSLHKFYKSQSKKGITVLIKKSEGRKKVKGKSNLNGLPFIAKMSNGHVAIFQRNNKIRKVKGKKKNYNTQGLTQLNTLSIPQMLGRENIMDYINNNGAEEMLSRNFEREVDKILKGYYRK